MSEPWCVGGQSSGDRLTLDVFLAMPEPVLAMPSPEKFPSVPSETGGRTMVVVATTQCKLSLVGPVEGGLHLRPTGRDPRLGRWSTLWA